MAALNFILLIPVFFIFVGLLYIFIVSKNRKYLIGYKLYGAKKSNENWSYTQKTVGKIYLILGLIGGILNLIFVLIEKYKILEISRGTFLYNIMGFIPSGLVIVGSLLSIRLIRKRLCAFYNRES